MMLSDPKRNQANLTSAPNLNNKITLKTKLFSNFKL
ncbi:MAG: hypothetical protein JWO32_712 [Bacteroidetes bacterium]|nr:hypothetical protein [Bacteroidota bacterium]